MARYLNTSCCDNPTHGTNVGKDDHATTLLDKIANLRSVLKSELSRIGVKNYWLPVLDGIGALLGYVPKQTRPNNKDCAESAAKLISRDGVHFVSAGYENIGKCVYAAIQGLYEGTLAKPDKPSDLISGSVKKSTYFWRGFVSPVGAAGLRDNYEQGSSSKHRNPRHHPYSRHMF
jgi:hypothetical protein